MVNATPRLYYPPPQKKETWRPLCRMLRWSPGPLCTGAENLVLTRIRPQAVQLAASRYIDCANPDVLAVVQVIFRKHYLENYIRSKLKFYGNICL